MKVLIIIGSILLYIAAGFGIFFLTKLLKRDLVDGEEGMVCVFFWPFILCLLLILAPIRLVEKGINLINEELDKNER